MQNCWNLKFWDNLLQIKLHWEENYYGTVKIDWKEVFMALNGTLVHLPKLAIIPLRDKFRLRCIIRKRPLLLHVMLRQGTSWYALDSKEYLLPPPC